VHNINSTSFLRFIAIILIVNSHLDRLYPLSQLATGGAIGNALFFMLSGYGIVLSEQHQTRTFFLWYRRRIARIYPSLILAVLFLFILPGAAWRHWSAGDYVQYFIWPTPYWFISALMIFYVVFFILMKQRRPEFFLIGIGVLAIPYLFFYVTTVDLSRYSIEGPGYFKWVFYLQVMFLGGYMASKRIRFIKTNLVRDGLALLGCIAGYYGILLLVSRGYGGQFQAATHLLMFPILFLFLKVSSSEFVTNRLMTAKYAGATISLVATLTLEIYLVHPSVYNQPALSNILFPFNIIVFWIPVIILSFTLNRVSRLVTRRNPTETLAHRQQK